MKLTRRATGVTPSLTLQITAKASRLKAEGVDVISFGAGEPDFNTPKFISDAAKEALDKGITRYTAASGTMELRTAVCEHLKKTQGLDYKPTQIIISNGAKHSLSNAINVTVEEGDEVIIPAPYWLTYPELVKLSGGIPVYVDTKESNYKLTPELLKKYITPKTVGVFINNPCNPTGVVYTKEDIYALAKELENHENVWIYSDEIYDQLAYEDEIISIATYSEKIKERTILINGVSKTYAMTGWRIGFSASEPNVAKAMGSIQSHSTSNPNSMAQYATIAALTDPKGDEFLAKMRKVFDNRRRLMIKLLQEAGQTIIQPKGAFYVMIDVSSYFGKTYKGKEIKQALHIAELLLDEENVAVIPCESFGASDFIRLSYATSENDITRGLERIISFFKKIG